MWRICWSSKETEYRGCGNFVWPTKEHAEEVCKKLNDEWPNIKHWPEQEIK